MTSSGTRTCIAAAVVADGLVPRPRHVGAADPYRTDPDGVARTRRLVVVARAPRGGSDRRASSPLGATIAAVLGDAYGGDVGTEIARLVVAFAPYMVARSRSVTFPPCSSPGGRRLPLGLAALAAHLPLAWWAAICSVCRDRVRAGGDDRGRALWLLHLLGASRRPRGLSSLLPLPSSPLRSPFAPAALTRHRAGRRGVGLAVSAFCSQPRVPPLPRRGATCGSSYDAAGMPSCSRGTGARTRSRAWSRAGRTGFVVVVGNASRTGQRSECASGTCPSK